MVFSGGGFLDVDVDVDVWVRKGRVGEVNVGR